MNKYLKIGLGVFIIFALIGILGGFTEGLRAQELTQGESLLARGIGYGVLISLMVLTWKGLISNKKVKD